MRLTGRVVLLSLMLVLLGGCSGRTALETTQYLLPMPEQVPALKSSPRIDLPIQIKTIKMPGYLDKPNIAMVDPDGQVYLASQHLWAESLSSQLEKMTLRRLKERLPTLTWIPSYQYIRPNLLLDIEVYRFHADRGGKIIASGHWSLWSASKQLLYEASFEKVAMMQQSGYPAMTQQLAQIWLTQIVDPIATTLATRP
ncbi:PqiC family protein [Vibrio rhizosphaerae]|uniref:PqiC family protein n=1 Tax=Vibrio rhizosphaerae TaxID=398736 RepID=A0ABU4IUI9_9VIBR|nr:PqiC family protein [Vibrio rhizosphaerae]MDW6093067.1 PqiC family protein [Vibrio rhizosphaerae]